MNRQQRIALIAIVAVALVSVWIVLACVVHVETTPAHADTFAHDVSDSMLAPTVDNLGAGALVKRPNEPKPQDAQPENTPESQLEATEGPDYVESDYVPETEYYEPYGGSEYANDFMAQGVVYDGGTQYTWYSSNVAYHYRTNEWTPDDEGFYRTDDGLYVVASSDYPEGTVVSTPWGDGVVLDSGCDSGTVDMYVAW